jgi:ankyrin repeat protein
VEYRHSRPLYLHPPYHHQIISIANMQYPTLQSQEEAFKFINYLWQNSCKFKKSNDLGKTAMNYARRNGLTKIIKKLACGEIFIQLRIIPQKTALS